MTVITLIAVIGTGCAHAPAATDRGPVGSTPSPAERQELLEQRREFAQCMRENGVADFPDPDADGHILYYGDNPNTKSAGEKCDRLEPGDRSRESGNGG